MTKTLQDYKDVLEVGDEVEFYGEWETVVEIDEEDEFPIKVNDEDGLMWESEITGYRPKKKTLETLEVGDYVRYNKTTVIRVLAAQGEGEYRTYVTSFSHLDTHDDTLETCEFLKKARPVYTAYELEILGYTPYTPEEDEETTLTMDEVAKKFGVAVDKLRIKKNDD